MARKGGSGGARRSGGRKGGGSRGHRAGGAAAKRNMRRGMRQMRGGQRGHMQQQKTHKPPVSGSSNMANLKMAAGMAMSRGFHSAHHAAGQGGFGADEPTALEAEMAYMSVYDQNDDNGDALQHHLELLSIEG